jgi:hypothetical protein
MGCLLDPRMVESIDGADVVAEVEAPRALIR